jgi:hypothetical protein
VANAEEHEVTIMMVMMWQHSACKKKTKMTADDEMKDESRRVLGVGKENRRAPFAPPPPPSGRGRTYLERGSLLQWLSV